MDHLLVSFYRQYLQQILPTNIRYPPVKLLVTTYIQDQIYRYFFTVDHCAFLPPPDYQRKVLKRIIASIERELSNGSYDDDEFGLSDELMAYMGTLSASPQQSDSEAAQTPRVLSYFVPQGPRSSDEDRPILIREAPNLLAAGSNVGLRTWEASLHLGYYLSTALDLRSKHIGNKEIEGARIIEVGAGTGLLSLICAQALKARRVIITDGLSHVMDGIQSNIELNLETDRTLNTDSIAATQLDWTDLSNLQNILQQDDDHLELDYILGADITYHPELFKPLANVLKILKTRFSRARVLIAATVRNEVTLQQFKQICSEDYGLRIREIEEKEWKCPSFKDQTGLYHEQAFPIIIMDIDLK